VENEPLKIFMALSDVERNRDKPLDAATVDRLAREYHTYGSQYPLFTESRALSEKSINLYLDTAAAITRMKEPLFHSDVAGTRGRWWGCGKSWCGSRAFRKAEVTPSSPAWSPVRHGPQ
jgi:hypothetical protein